MRGKTCDGHLTDFIAFHMDRFYSAWRVKYLMYCLFVVFDSKTNKTLSCLQMGHAYW
jgi:hypothetical protein